MAERSFKCPNCNNVIYKSFGMPHNIGCPIRICPHCKKEYNHPYTYEWSIISPLHKFAYCFFWDGRAFFFLFNYNPFFFGNLDYINHFFCMLDCNLYFLD